MILKLLSPLNPDLVYLFGSAARDQLTPTSDVDIATLSRTPLPPEPAFLLSQEIAKTLGREVDLISLNTSSDVLRMQVIKTGRPLYARSRHILSLFEMYAFSDYVRTNEERAPILKRIQAEGTVYGS